MTRNQKYMLGLAAVLLGLAIKLPIWRIDIWAPQYPEGLSMQIFAGRIDGNVDQINILNHYIGMKHILPDQIPELIIIPWILYFVVFFGILVNISNRLFFAKVWLALLGILSIGGMIDFYQWGYDYGHNLSPDAPIKISGFSYQPPLFGYKKILNIEAYSLPDWGAYALGIGILLVTLAIYWTTILNFVKNQRKVRFIVLLLLPAFFVSCTVKPESLNIGDECQNCHMRMTDLRFGGELITKKGRHLKFDSIRCLLEYLSKYSEQAESIFVSDYFHSGTLIDVREAHFLLHSTISGTMGPDAVASKDEFALEKIKTQSSGKVTDWKGLSLSLL